MVFLINISKCKAHIPMYEKQHNNSIFILTHYATYISVCSVYTLRTVENEEQNSFLLVKFWKKIYEYHKLMGQLC